MERNRILALVLALVLVAGIMPIHAFAAEPLDFSDVPEGFWAEEAIDYMSSNGYLLGNKDGTFGPTDSIMRKTVALLLYRIEGQPTVSGSMPFPDVGGKTYHDAILWASQAGIVTGYGDGTFRPDNTISRQHFAIMLYRYANYKACGLVGDENKALADFSDEASISKASKEACLWAYQNGIISGRANGTFDPNGTTTRAQLAVIMSRFLSKAEASGHEHEYDTFIVSPTCIEPLHDKHICRICGHTYKDNYAGEALDHQMLVTERVNPTEDTDGYLVFTCRYAWAGCTETETETVTYEDLTIDTKKLEQYGIEYATNPDGPYECRYEPGTRAGYLPAVTSLIITMNEGYREVKSAVDTTMKNLISSSGNSRYGIDISVEYIGNNHYRIWVYY